MAAMMSRYCCLYHPQVNTRRNRDSPSATYARKVCAASVARALACASEQCLVTGLGKPQLTWSKIGYRTAASRLRDFAGSYASSTGSVVCAACPVGEVTSSLGAPDPSACAAPPTVVPLNATVFNAAGSCQAAIDLYNSLYNATLNISQQVCSLREYGDALILHMMLRNS